jgi:hypothetical protein
MMMLNVPGRPNISERFATVTTAGDVFPCDDIASIAPPKNIGRAISVVIADVLNLPVKTDVAVEI